MALLQLKKLATYYKIDYRTRALAVKRRAETDRWNQDANDAKTRKI
jgi:hypothetical protein